jgi:MFS family permease
MTASSAILSAKPVRATIETRGSWIVCLTALGIAAVSFAAPTVTVVGLKSIAADLGGERSVPAVAYSLAWLGASFGGLPMGRLAERFGVRFTVMFGATMIAVGLVIAQSGGKFGLFVGYGLFVGLLGNSGINAPLYVYVSRWFDRRRGTALALLGSGSSCRAFCFSAALAWRSAAGSPRDLRRGRLLRCRLHPRNRVQCRPLDSDRYARLAPVRLRHFTANGAAIM